MIQMDEIRSRIAGLEPDELDLTGRNQAAVALILRATDAGPEILFIERARREGDPWSGHMAFPGGRLEPHDPHLRATAERETIEEIGLSLEAAHHLGHIGDVLGSPRVQSELVIRAHAYEIPTEVPPLTLDHREVAAAIWFPLAELHAPERHVHFATPPLERTRFPGIEVGVPERQVVWGLTYRFLDIFFQALERPFPDRWGSLRTSERR